MNLSNFSLLGGTSSILRIFLGGTSEKTHPVEYYSSCHAFRSQFYRAEGVKESKDKEAGQKVSQGPSHAHAPGHVHAPGHAHGTGHAHAQGHAHGPAQAQGHSQAPGHIQGSRTKSPLKETSQVNVASKENAEESEERKMNRYLNRPPKLVSLEGEGE